MKRNLIIVAIFAAALCAANTARPSSRLLSDRELARCRAGYWNEGNCEDKGACEQQTTTANLQKCDTVALSSTMDSLQGINRGVACTTDGVHPCYGDAGPCGTTLTPVNDTDSCVSAPGYPLACELTRDESPCGSRQGYDCVTNFQVEVTQGGIQYNQYSCAPQTNGYPMPVGYYNQCGYFPPN